MAIELPDARHLSDDVLQSLRLRALRGIELGYTELELADLLGVCHETISRWWSAYTANGASALPGDRTGRPVGVGRLLTDDQAKHLRQILDSSLPAQRDIPHALWTRRAVQELIQKEFGITLAERTVGQYLRRWGYTPKKPARHGRQQDPDKVEQWLEETYPAIEVQALRENAEILWTDEVGVAADHHPGTGYARRGERATMDVPRPHIRVNQISAISNEGRVQFMTYQGMLTAAVFLEFLRRLVAGAKRKVLLIADSLQAHKTPEVMAWLADHQSEIAIFYLPAYSPELNPVEYLNNDMKATVNEAGLPDNRGALQERIAKFMTKLATVPAHVVSYFLHPWAQYAAPVELL
jgi:transposase